MKHNIKQLVKDHIAIAKEVGFSDEIISRLDISHDVCNLFDLQELLSLIPDEAIRQAVEDEEADKVRETQADFRASGYCQ